MSERLEQDELERIVRRCVAEVLARVDRAGGEPLGCGDLWRVPERVVTLRSLAGRLDGLREIRVRPDAIVTPAARDELRQRNIAVVTIGGQPADRRAARLLLAACEPPTAAPELLATLESLGAAATWIETDNLPHAVRQLAAALGGQRRAVLVTRQVAPAVCLANRDPAVRAAWGADADAAAHAVQALDANLLVVDARAVGTPRWTQILQPFLRAVGRPPER